MPLPSLPLPPPGNEDRGRRALVLGLYDVAGVSFARGSRLSAYFTPFVVLPAPDGTIDAGDRAQLLGVFWRASQRRSTSSRLYLHLMPWNILPETDGEIDVVDRGATLGIYDPSLANAEPPVVVPPEEEFLVPLVAPNTYAIYVTGRPRGAGYAQDLGLVQEAGMTILLEERRAGEAAWTGHGDRAVLAKLAAFRYPRRLPHWAVLLPVGVPFTEELVRDWASDYRRVLVEGAVPPGLRS